MVTIASEGQVLFPKRAEVLLGMMLSVPGADRGPRAGSPRGVVDATGSQFTARSSCQGHNPVATAPGTDLTTLVSRFSITFRFAYYQQRFIDLPFWRNPDDQG